MMETGSGKVHVWMLTDMGLKVKQGAFGDTSLLNNPGSSVFSGSDISNAFQNFQMTMSGSALGDGVFAASDFNSVAFDTYVGTLDFNSELVGQPVLNGLWGAPWGIFSFSPINPSGPFSQENLGISGARLRRQPKRAAPVDLLCTRGPGVQVAVPETSTWVMGFLALGAVVFMVHQRRLRN